MELLTEWNAWRPGAPPHVLDADRPLLSSDRSAQAIELRSSWREAYSADDFAAPGDKSLHLGLLPTPFFGDLRRATIFLLLLNPGLGPHDYYGEHEVPEFRKALLANLRQDFSGNPFPFLFLDPRFSWHGGFDWWHTKLARVIDQLANSWATSFAIARSRLASEIASIELLPYHSASFRDADHWLKKLPSVGLARDFVTDVVLPRVRSRNAIVIVTRKAREWNLPSEHGVVIYNAGEARAVHLTPTSKGGKAMLDFLLLGEDGPDLSAA